MANVISLGVSAPLDTTQAVEKEKAPTRNGIPLGIFIPLDVAQQIKHYVVEATDLIGKCHKLDRHFREHGWQPDLLIERHCLEQEKIRALLKVTDIMLDFVIPANTKPKA